MIFPIGYAIPKCKIVKSIPPKDQYEANALVGYHGEFYTFDTEADYYKEYQRSWYGKTKVKGGWDCLRHYEILAQGCIPQFEDLSSCPVTALTHFPKDLVLQATQDKENIEELIRFTRKQFADQPTNAQEIVNSLNTILEEKNKITIHKLLEYTREKLTTEAMAQYVLNSIPVKNVRRVLFLSGGPRPEYQRCLLLHGFKEIFGPNCHEIYCVDHIYKGFSNIRGIYGRGMTYSANLDKKKYRNESLDDTFTEDILNHWYDIIIYGCIKDFPKIHWDFVNEHYKKEEIIMVCGEDYAGDFLPQLKNWSTAGHPVFVRELRPEYMEQLQN
jgi:hypothetical protein